MNVMLNFMNKDVCFMNLTAEECEMILFLIKGYAENLMCKDKEYADKSFKLVRKMVRYVVENKGE